MMEKISKKASKKAAKWWADQLRGTAKLDNGDKSPTGGMTRVLATMVQSVQPKHSESEILLFEMNLAKLIKKERSHFVGVDYNPDYTLSSAAELSNIQLSMTDFPWKTNMMIDGDVVKVSRGDGANYVEI